MTEIRTLVRPVRVEKKCECGGLLQYTGQSMSSGFSSEHWHRCSSGCGAMAKFPVKYPRVEYEDIVDDLPAASTDIELHLGGWFLTEDNVVVNITSVISNPGKENSYLFIDQNGRAYFKNGTNVLWYASTPFTQEFNADNIKRSLNSEVCQILFGNEF